ncbi:asparagine synthase-related protein [Streptomyces iconiensis]|uniref:Asparagine synthase-related protein n=1 Tax=Streptomyces iconiensis TaxID=1384038 RepID=A0ABT7A648_9ACTN|nr:asparagine synthase-related protein [Streptomyces iconiensis]MDJ1136819.1 asparagine synthase-related protein [Streptomyces iconiensis]
MVLPDCEAASAVFAKVRDRACQVLAHASGRPWLAGCWQKEEAHLAVVGEVRLAMLGTCGLDRDALLRRARAVGSLSEVEEVGRGVAGSFHLLASVSGQVYARGTAVGDRRLHHTRVGGVTVLADRARTLAWLIQARVDMAQAAVRMSSLGSPPHPFDQASMFLGVHVLAPGRALELGRNGYAGERRWWRAPTAELPPAEGASGLRTALREAVRARVRPGQVWAADLSGGMDSTSLCFLASEAGAELVALTLDWGNPEGEDPAYARKAVADLPSGTVHLLFPSARLPPYLTGLGDGGEPDDEPSLKQRDLAQQEHLSHTHRSRGARRRLCGHGGDHVVLPPTSHLHDLVRHQPRLASRYLAGYAAKYRWPRARTLRVLADRRPYGTWLAAQAETLLGGTGTAPSAPPAWDPPVGMPFWATARAREMYANLLREAAHTLPLAATRGRHGWIHQARQAGRVALIYDQYGMGLEMPFCDDAVLHACLRVRAHEAATPWTYKPLLAAAMRGIVPAPLLNRTTKGDATREWHTGLKVQQRCLAAWLEDSRLVAAGLAEPRALRHAWLSPATLRAADGPAVEFTLAVESWLRGIERHPVPAHLREHPREPSSAR